MSTLFTLLASPTLAAFAIYKTAEVLTEQLTPRAKAQLRDYLETKYLEFLFWQDRVLGRTQRVNKAAIRLKNPKDLAAALEQEIASLEAEVVRRRTMRERLRKEFQQRIDAELAENKGTTLARPTDKDQQIST